MTDMPERIWADDDSWSSREPKYRKSTQYIRADLCGPAAEAALAAEKARVARLVEAADYLLRAADDLMDRPTYTITDVHLKVKEGAKIQSVADARAALAQINTQGTHK